MANKIVAQQNQERNLVRQMPKNTAMGHLQRNHRNLLTQSGAIDGGRFAYACQAASETTAILRREMPELY